MSVKIENFKQRKQLNINEKLANYLNFLNTQKYKGDQVDILK
jgi:hypothetical protein